MLLKLDLSKAYGKLSWQFMKEILKYFGFAKEWVTWVIVTYSIPLMQFEVMG